LPKQVTLALEWQEPFLPCDTRRNLSFLHPSYSPYSKDLVHIFKEFSKIIFEEC
jgi:hypothetical protein